MQVSSVCANRFSAVEIPENNDKVETVVTDNSYSAFTSSLKKTDLNMDNIVEWKLFCQNQIAANNLDYIV